jgi:hypothetical protein
MAIFTQTQYTTLIAAIALGALEVEYGDKTVKYRTLAEMKELANDMAKDLGLEVPFNKNAGRRFADYHSGK